MVMREAYANMYRWQCSWCHAGLSGNADLGAGSMLGGEVAGFKWEEWFGVHLQGWCCQANANTMCNVQLLSPKGVNEF